MKENDPHVERTYVSALNAPLLMLGLACWAVLGLLVVVVMALAKAA
jgi:hypothetical protein